VANKRNGSIVLQVMVFGPKTVKTQQQQRQKKTANINFFVKPGNRNWQSTALPLCL